MSGDPICVDLFAGGGGTSTGLAQACKQLGKNPQLTAVNHWDIAIETHKRNHPWARHLCTGLDQIHPGEIYPKGRLDLLVASPECIHHSNARGGKPMCDQSRSSPWLVMKWLQDLYVDSVLIENVPEFLSWGPLGADGRPLKSKRGVSFESFISNLKALGYNVEWRVLNAADYGDATVRERLFVQAKRGRDKKIHWPEKTYFSNSNQTDMFRDSSQRWRPAREIIDWSLPSQSIFGRKRPLAPATIERIAAGLKKFCGKAAEPFLVVLRNHADGRSVSEPVPTVTAGGQHLGLCQPFVVPQFSTGAPRSVERPIGTITTTSRGIGICEPFLCTAGGPAGQARTAKSINRPMPTVLTENHHGLVKPFVFSMEHSRSKFVMPVNHGTGDHRTYGIDRPMPTITTVDAWGVVEPILVEYYGTGTASPVSEPLHTITTKDRFALVEFDGMLIDIHFRMLQWRELAAAQSFPADYDFAGTREQIVRQIGNAVPVRQAQALCMMLLGAA